MQSTQTTQRTVRLPVIGAKASGADAAAADAAADAAIDAELKRFEAEQRQALGLDSARDHFVDKNPQRFTKEQRPHTTLLLGGLTVAHDYLIAGALGALGYKVKPLDCPDNGALQFGKEFGNRGQCNPTYFTVGNLVKYLVHLRDVEGVPQSEIVSNYLFITAGACGPCRFGTYVTEYRKALRDAGFDGFRVMLFQQQGGLKQATGEATGLEFTPPFFIGLLLSIMVGDVLNAIGYRMRPYEKEKGATDRALDECKRITHDALAQRKNILWALLRCRAILRNVEVDRTLSKPKVSVIGEFWAMTTEGDGNYQLQRFLESEGAEVDIQIVTNWLLYQIWEHRWDTQQRMHLRGVDQGRKGLAGIDPRKKLAGLWVADRALRVIFKTFAGIIGLHDYPLPDMDQVADAARDLYNNHLRGGEGHMEVGKLVLNVQKKKSTMTLSVKPFGCMPSSGVSDGVQSWVTEKHPGAIFLPIETSGDGAVNVYSRVQMMLFKARNAARAEFDAACAEAGVSPEELRLFLARNPRFQSPFFWPDHKVTSTAADLVHNVAPYMKDRWHGLKQLGRRAGALLRRGGEAAAH
jgi:predicted nucleotide-binding protein (sugar kinase/HSP70/actin superfamily)